ncbi:MAG: hypothetical protein LUG18_00575 [Candidatus Azobacteroides sp.]|nr:hypothetical protein [Candidatus Azobacteroides sp.]
MQTILPITKGIYRYLLVTGLWFMATGISYSSDTTIKIDDFSDKYYALLEIESRDDYYSYGTLSMYEKSTGKELFHTPTLIPTSALDDIRSNIKELPYGEQSMIIYEDFNFDNIKDFAIRDGNYSCYSGPSYIVFLAKGNNFVKDEDFTGLAQDYCGMFRTDLEAQRIYTMTKSGCCWHQYSEFSVENNKPRLEKELSVDVSNPFYISRETIKIRKGEEMEEEEVHYLIPEHLGEESVLFTFLIPGKKRENDKRMYLLYENDHLQYFFIKDASNEIELHYPDALAYDKGEYIWEYDPTPDKTEEETGLGFTRPGAAYRIYETDREVGIRVKVNNKMYDIKGDKFTQQGTLRNLTEKIGELKNK